MNFSVPFFPVHPSSIQGGLSFHNYSVFLAKRAAEHSQVPPLRGIQLPECSRFFTWSWRGPERPSNSTSDHGPGSSVPSRIGHRCAVGVMRPNVAKCVRGILVKVEQAPSDSSSRV